MPKNIFPRIEVLPHPVEVGLDYAERAGRFVMSILRNTNVPLHASEHYVREHFTDEPVQPPVSEPAQPWNQE